MSPNSCWTMIRNISAGKEEGKERAKEEWWQVSHQQMFSKWGREIRWLLENLMSWHKMRKKLWETRWVWTLVYDWTVYVSVLNCAELLHSNLDIKRSSAILWSEQKWRNTANQTHRGQNVNRPKTSEKMKTSRRFIWKQSLSFHSLLCGSDTFVFHHRSPAVQLCSSADTMLLRAAVCRRTRSWPPSSCSLTSGTSNLQVFTDRPVHCFCT